MNQVQLLKVVGHLPLEHQFDLLNTAFVHRATLNGQVEQFLLMIHALEDVGQLLAIKSVIV